MEFEQLKLGEGEGYDLKPLSEGLIV